ncbi:Uncharacterized protein APZ42_010840, partial [Daphnia magna]
MPASSASGYLHHHSEKPLYYKHLTSRKKQKQADPTVVNGWFGFGAESPDMEPLTEAPAMEPTEKGTIKQPKSYACLFTCAVTRAVHLELTKTMSASDFLLAFRRISARRGSVSIMYSIL